MLHINTYKVSNFDQLLMDIYLFIRIVGLYKQFILGPLNRIMLITKLQENFYRYLFIKYIIKYYTL
jgi:hypothetical protein